MNHRTGIQEPRTRSPTPSTLFSGHCTSSVRRTAWNQLYIPGEVNRKLRSPQFTLNFPPSLDPSILMRVRLIKTASVPCCLELQSWQAKQATPVTSRCKCGDSIFPQTGAGLCVKRLRLSPCHDHIVRSGHLGPEILRTVTALCWFIMRKSNSSTQVAD